MNNSIKSILEGLEKINYQQEKVESVSAPDLTLLEKTLLQDWQEYKTLTEAPQQPPGTAAPGQRVDPKTVTTINRLKTITKDRSIVPSVAAAGIAKQAAGQIPNTGELKQMTLLNRTLSGAATAALLSPKQGPQTLNAISGTIRTAEQERKKQELIAKQQQQQQRS